MTDQTRLASRWTKVAMAWLPFADVASADLPLLRLLRLALFQVSVGMAAVLLNGTLNRVMIVELSIPAWLVALMIAIPLLVAPLRALIGHRSDTHRSILGWRRVPYIWFGTLMQFGGLAIMPFALLLLGRSGDEALGVFASMLAFLLTGLGMHMTQTAGLALATDLAPDDKRPRAVALLYVMLLAGTMVAALSMGALLLNFTPTRLVQVIQGAAVLTFFLNVVALWKQETRRAVLSETAERPPAFGELWNAFISRGRVSRLLATIGIGAAGFAMQDALLEPYGGEILGLSVGATTALTGAWAAGALAGFALSGRMLSHGGDPLRLAGNGLVIGVTAFLMILFAAPFASIPMLFAGACAIGLGLGLFSVGTLIEAMGLAKDEGAGLVLGAWGAVQAGCAGLAIAIGGGFRDIISAQAAQGTFGGALGDPVTGYAAVYCLEILILLASLVALGPLVSQNRERAFIASGPLGLREFPT
ncbi:BCD family MFS transporter [Qipengyuania qiaonensis]|uniref:BCD family MFS transporter n=1 Tax=Qipengyuania qiaonensis TaxID=2867240 RepID=A0ABS7J889_9SPHN|nr:BCD family MFS transporter [Qipengyuania qiaonensis]MBX7483536.1 BCD family MFS transporter [Qipengyuania qiaonensis]